MNNNPTLATLWKGRILLSLLANPQENPKLSSQKTTEPLSEHLIKQLNNKDLMEWCLIAEIHYGLCFPSKKNHYQIEIRWADQELTFGKAEPKGNLWEWYSRQKFKCPFPYTSFNDLPDVFIYLKDGSDRLCFIRETAEHFINNLIEKPKFYFFKPELSKNPGNKCHEAGLIKMRIAIGFIDMFDEFNASGWGEELVRPTMRNIYLFANMYHAKELIPADDDGSSDPFYSLEYYGVEEISDVIHDSLNPVIK